MEFKHIPVMKEEVIAGLDLKDDGIYVDGTVGGAGHSFEILNRTKNSVLYAFDKDLEAIEASKKRLEQFGNRVRFFHADFKQAPEILKKNGVTVVDGVLLDLGVSSYQLDNKDRGFSISKPARLDMRMNTESSKDAYMVVNFYPEEKLRQIIKDFGEEQFAKKIAFNIAVFRATRPIETTEDLAKIVDMSVPHYKNKSSIDNQRRVFQAIRIEVNDELDGLFDTIKNFSQMLKPGGRIAVLDFHSLEDRIVKQVFADLAKDCICPPKTPVCICGHRAELKMITKKPVTASEKELKINSRSSCAKLRIAEHV